LNAEIGDDLVICFGVGLETAMPNFKMTGRLGLSLASLPHNLYCLNIA
jgi:hypothetical protein